MKYKINKNEIVYIEDKKQEELDRRWGLYLYVKQCNQVK